MKTLSRLDFVSWLLLPAMKAWWAVLTGTASVAALFLAPAAGLLLSPGWLFLLVLVNSLLVFTTLSVVVQGWTLFRNRAVPIRVVNASKTKNDYGATILFVLGGPVEGIGNAVLEIRRVAGEQELPFAVVQVVDRTDGGNLMAIPLHVAPTALRDFNAHAFGVADMRVKGHVTFDRLVEARDGIWS